MFVVAPVLRRVLMPFGTFLQLGGGLVFLGLFFSSFASQLWHLYLSFGALTGAGFSLSFAPGVIATA
jgi:MFS family permease